MTENLKLSMGFDLSLCSLITAVSLDHMSRLPDLRVVNLEGCTSLRDGCLDPVADFCNESLEVLSVAGIANMTDEGLKKIAAKCSKLTMFSANNCPNISCEMIVSIVQANKRISSLFISATQVRPHLTSLFLYRIEKNRKE